MKHVGIIFIFLFAGCHDPVFVPEIYQPSKCFEGVVVGADCPSFLFVQVIDADIGKKWVIGNKVYENALSIQNFVKNAQTDLVAVGKKVFFSIDIERTKRKERCVNVARPCPSVLYYESYPEVTVCAKSISGKSCDN